mmetsp:Transcript_39095/g.51557  ORF Transcript_39095/g.51557 Transcript_39095/m.51557 type:complete len:303 (+) Transcript_39095:3091-3999(+)
MIRKPSLQKQLPRLHILSPTHQIQKTWRTRRRRRKRSRKKPRRRPPKQRRLLPRLQLLQRRRRKSPNKARPRPTRPPPSQTNLTTQRTGSTQHSIMHSSKLQHKSRNQCPQLLRKKQSYTMCLMMNFLLELKKKIQLKNHLHSTLLLGSQYLLMALCPLPHFKLPLQAMITTMLPKRQLQPLLLLLPQAPPPMTTTPTMLNTMANNMAGRFPLLLQLLTPRTQLGMPSTMDRVRQPGLRLYRLLRLLFLNPVRFITHLLQVNVTACHLFFFYCMMKHSVLVHFFHVQMSEELHSHTTKLCAI